MFYHSINVNTKYFVHKTHRKKFTEHHLETFQILHKMWWSWKCVDKRPRKEVILYINITYAYWEAFFPIRFLFYLLRGNLCVHAIKRFLKWYCLLLKSINSLVISNKQYVLPLFYNTYEAYNTSSTSFTQGEAPL